jgi:hypothetical protein
MKEMWNERWKSFLSCTPRISHGFNHLAQAERLSRQLHTAY